MDARCSPETPEVSGWLPRIRALGKKHNIIEADKVLTIEINDPMELRFQR